MKAQITGLHSDNTSGKFQTTAVDCTLIPETYWEQLALELIKQNKLKITVKENDN